MAVDGVMEAVLRGAWRVVGNEWVVAGEVVGRWLVKW